MSNNNNPVNITCPAQPISSRRQPIFLGTQIAGRAINKAAEIHVVKDNIVLQVLVLVGSAGNVIVTVYICPNHV